MMGRGGEPVGVLQRGVMLLRLGMALSLAAAAAAAAGEGEGINSTVMGRGGGENSATRGTIAFASLGRAHYGFDLFGIKLPSFWMSNTTIDLLPAGGLDELRLTDGVSINYNGQLVEGEARAAVLEHVRNQGVNVADEASVLVFASERDGSTRIYFNIFSSEIQTMRESDIFLHTMLAEHPRRREIIQREFSKPGNFVLDAGLQSNGPAFFDKPLVVGDSILYVSTKQASKTARESWAAVYSTSIRTQTTRRLTPKGTADFSPSVSPSGEWVAVASSESGIHVETRELVSDLYVFRAKDGSDRTLVVKHAGWPSWADDHTIFFHRLADDGWWSIFRVTLPENFLSTGEGVVREERITPPGVHAVTPAASQVGNWVAVATRRPGSLYRHIEMFSLSTNSFTKLTEKLSPQTQHYNPFVSSYSGFVGYHRCRGNSDGVTSVVPLLQEVRSPLPDLAIVRIDGTVPSFSPDGSLLAYAGDLDDSTADLAGSLAGLFVSNGDGSGARQVFSGQAFSPAWDRKRKNVLYAAIGPIFQSTKPVQIISLHNVVGKGEVYTKPLTKAGNNAWPSPSPDGKHLVFRSGRSGHENLYIMDAEEGEEKEIQRLTEGEWTDTHPNWSPSGEWIAFTSDRERPGSGSMAIYMMHPDGTGLHKVLESAHTGLAVHPIFSPDSKKLVFVSDFAGTSAEPVAQPFLYRPYGEIFTADVDGSNIVRLTHNYVEDGTPAWSPTFLSSSNVSGEGKRLSCSFGDATWLNSEVQHSHQRYSVEKLPSIKCY